MKSTAVANANIALIKYWGKRNSELVLPYNNSISMTCDGLLTKTTVEFDSAYTKDTITINGEPYIKGDKDLFAHIERIRRLARIKQFAKIVSETNFPIAAGLASSASGIAALTVAAAAAAGINMNARQLSALARLGCGSASRSIMGGFVEWKKGERSDGEDSYAVQIAKPDHWPDFRMIATIVSKTAKPVGSNIGMAQTVATCPYFKGWLETVDTDLAAVRQGITNKDFQAVGYTAEINALKMHAMMIATRPPIIYWIPGTMDIIHAVFRWRAEGLPCYLTIDGGPNVKVMCLQKDERELNTRLLAIKSVERTILSRPGEDARTVEEHLF